MADNEKSPAKAGDENAQTTKSPNKSTGNVQIIVQKYFQSFF